MIITQARHPSVVPHPWNISPKIKNKALRIHPKTLVNNNNKITIMTALIISILFNIIAKF